MISLIIILIRNLKNTFKRNKQNIGLFTLKMIKLIRVEELQLEAFRANYSLKDFIKKQNLKDRLKIRYS